ncbi:MAG: hypothetical protein RL129_112 [Actinomycetota bacterium]|jgi:hypothetical protein
MNRYIPISKRQDPESWLQIVLEIPSFLRENLFAWLNEYLNEEAATQIAIFLQVDLVKTSFDPVDTLLRYAGISDETMIDVLDVALAHVQIARVNGAPKLEKMLSLANFEWKVKADNGGLEKRVASEIADWAIEKIDPSESCGKFLSSAWANHFGTHPDFSKSYSESVKALEALLIPIVSPKNMKATLGSVIGELNANISTFEVLFEENANTKAIIVKDLLKLIWQNQDDRHGGVFHPEQITEDESRFALFTALYIRSIVS